MSDAVLVFDVPSNPALYASEFRRDLTAMVQARFPTTLVATSQDISRVADALPQANLVIVELGALVDERVQRAVADVMVWALVLPPSHPLAPESRTWVANIRQVCEQFAHIRFIVDSQDARDYVETACIDRRVDALVFDRTLRGDFIDEDGIRLTAAAAEHSLPLTAGESWLESWPETLDKLAISQPSDDSISAWTDPAPQRYLDELIARSTPPADRVAQRVSVMGAHLNFFQQLHAELSRGHVEAIRSYEWTHLSSPPSKDIAQQILRDSDVVIAEWIRPSAAYIQEHARHDSRLIVRGHRYEVTTDFPRKVNMNRYDAAVVITPWVGRALVQDFGWPTEKIVYIPNYVDARYFYRPKLSGSQFTLGMVGIRPSLKRIDLALALLKELRTIDPRYNLRIKSATPFDWINWNKDAASQAQWLRTLHTIKHDPLLRGAVFFDPAGQDMSAWFRHIGVILSLSDIEGSHVALAEGIASGCLPIAREWPGIRGLWPQDLIYGSVTDAVQAILAVREDFALENHNAAYRTLASLDQDKVIAAWKLLIAGKRDQAREVFGVIDTALERYAPHSS